MVNILEIATLQENYATLVKNKNLSKKAICDLCIPFRDKAGLTDLQTLRIARREVNLTEILQICGIDTLLQNIDEDNFKKAMATLNFYRNCHYADSNTTEEYQLAHAINYLLPIFAKLIGRE